MVNVKESENLKLKYVDIFEVKAKRHDGRVVTYCRYFDRKRAEEERDFAREIYKDIYESWWIMQESVWFD